MVTTRLVAVYKVWQQYQILIPKQLRYSLGTKIDGIFVDLVESVVTASFLTKEHKLPHVTKAIVKLDVLKFFLMTLWEVRGLDTGKYTAVSEPLAEIGKMLGGWRNQLIKQNSDVPLRTSEK